MSVNQPEPIWVPKGWGGEKWLDNRDEYCCKILNIIKNKKLSVHYHAIKTETFYCLSGKLYIKYHDNHEELVRLKKEGHSEQSIVETMETLYLGPDETFHVPKYRVHQITALVDSKIIEVSTKHLDSDSYRIIKGD